MLKMWSFFIIIIFATEKILCILHEQVFVMLGSWEKKSLLMTLDKN